MHYLTEPYGIKYYYHTSFRVGEITDADEGRLLDHKGLREKARIYIPFS